MAFTATLAPPDLAERVVGGRRCTLERCIRVALALGIAIQVAQRFLMSGYAISEYGRSLWFVTYEFGFVRRGLAGEALRSLLGHSPSLQTVDIVQNVIALLMLAVAAALVALLCRQRTVIGYAMAGLLVVAPFGFDSIGGQRRPDLVGFMLLGGLGIWAATSRVHAIALGLVGGVLLAGCALVSEVSPLIVGPWLVLVVAASARAREQSRAASWVAMLLAAMPSVLTLAVLVTVGQASKATVTALEGTAPPEIRGHGTVFTYLDDTFGRSIAKVIAGPSRLALSIIVGAFLAGLLLFCVRRALPYMRGTFEWILPTRLLRRAWGLGMLAGAALLFALGLDWLRWITSFFFAGLLAAGAVVALADRSAAGPPERELWHRPLALQPRLSTRAVVTVAVAIYLLLVPPLPNWIRGPASGARLLLGVP